MPFGKQNGDCILLRIGMRCKRTYREVEANVRSSLVMGRIEDTYLTEIQVLREPTISM